MSERYACSGCGAVVTNGYFGEIDSRTGRQHVCIEGLPERQVAERVQAARAKLEREAARARGAYS